MPLGDCDVDGETYTLRRGFTSIYLLVGHRVRLSISKVRVREKKAAHLNPNTQSAGGVKQQSFLTLIYKQKERCSSPT